MGEKVLNRIVFVKEIKNGSPVNGWLKYGVQLNNPFLYRLSSTNHSFIIEHGLDDIQFVHTEFDDFLYFCQICKEQGREDEKEFIIEQRGITNVFRKHGYIDYFNYKGVTWVVKGKNYG